MSSSTLLHLLLLSSLLFSCFPNAKPKTFGDEFSYIEGSPNGPENWGRLRPEWKTCGFGTEQSPIDFPDDRLIRNLVMGRLRTNYQAASATLRDNGHDVMVQFNSDAGSVFINRVRYQLKRVHFHSPSEHTINGERFDFEVQMVHESQDRRTAVIARLYRFGSPDPFFSQLEDFVKQFSNGNKNEINAGIVNTTQLELDDPAYYRYMGSYTAPPCTEGITWTVIKKVGTVSPMQVLLLKEAMQESAINNARPVQRLDYRPIFYYERVNSDDDAM